MNRPASELYNIYFPGSLEGLEGVDLLAFDSAHLVYAMKRERDAAESKGSAAGRVDAARARGGYDDLVAHSRELSGG